MIYRIDDNGNRVAVDPALFGVAPTPPQRAKRLTVTHAEAEALRMHVESLTGRTGAEWYETTQEIYPHRADPVPDNDEDRGTYMLVMVLGWVIYFCIGLIVGLAI